MALINRNRVEVVQAVIDMLKNNDAQYRNELLASIRNQQNGLGSILAKARPGTCGLFFSRYRDAENKKITRSMHTLTTHRFS